MNILEKKQYAVLVKDADEAKEVIELFKELGYVMKYSSDFHFHEQFPRYVITQEYPNEFRITGLQERAKEDSYYTLLDKTKLQYAVNRKVDKPLTAKEAKYAWANGGEVQISFNKDADGTKIWRDILDNDYLLVFNQPRAVYRTKPVKVESTYKEVSLPKTFNPQCGEEYFSVDVGTGQVVKSHVKAGVTVLIAWRYEDEAKEALDILLDLCEE